MDGVAGFRIYRDYRMVNEPKNVAGNCTVQVSVYPEAAPRINDNNNSTYWCPTYHYPATVEMTASQPMELSKIGIQWFSTYSAGMAANFNVLVWINDSWSIIAEVRNNTQLYNEINLNGILSIAKVKLEILAGPNYAYLAELKLFDPGLVKEMSFIDSVLENRIYTYYVSAVSAGNFNSESSNPVSISVADKTPPAPPTGFTVTEQSGSLLLRWTPNSEKDLAGYNIYVGESNVPLNNGLLTASQYTYSIPSGVSVFGFRLYAVDINGNQSAPATANFSFTRPLPPVNLQTATNKKNITLTWSAPGSLNISGYKVFRNGNLVNGLSRVSPDTMNASSYYCNNSNYQPAKVSDQNINTFWRPGLNDPYPYIEIKYNSLAFISAIEIGWHDINERPSAYMVEAWVNGLWQPLITDLK